MKIEKMIKKLITVFFVLALSLSLCSCGGNYEKKVSDALQGSWSAEWTAMGQKVSRYYTFKDNKYTTGGVAALFGDVGTETGTFEVKDKVIHLVPDDESKGKDLDYSFDKNSGTVVLWWNDEVQLIKGSADINYNY